MGFFFISSLVLLNKLCSVSLCNHSDIQIHVPVDQEKCQNLSVMLYILYLILFCPSVPPSPLVVHWKLHLPPKNTSSVYLYSSFVRSPTCLHATFLCSTFSYIHIFPIYSFSAEHDASSSSYFLDFYFTCNSAKIRTLKGTIFWHISC